jgi:hypothetical protein
VTFTMTMGVSGDNLGASLSLPDSQNYSISPYDGFDAYGAQGSGSCQSIFTAAPALDACTGSGSISLNGDLSYGPTFLSSSDDPSYAFHEGDGFLYGSITYDYSVPETASTLPLLILAGGFLFVAGKFKRPLSIAL